MESRVVRNQILQIPPELPSLRDSHRVRIIQQISEPFPLRLFSLTALNKHKFLPFLGRLIFPLCLGIVYLMSQNPRCITLWDLLDSLTLWWQWCLCLNSSVNWDGWWLYLKGYNYSFLLAFDNRVTQWKHFVADFTTFLKQGTFFWDRQCR